MKYNITFDQSAIYEDCYNIILDGIHLGHTFYCDDNTWQAVVDMMLFAYHPIVNGFATKEHAAEYILMMKGYK